MLTAASSSRASQAAIVLQPTPLRVTVHQQPAGSTIPGYLCQVRARVEGGGPVLAASLALRRG